MWAEPEAFQLSRMVWSPSPLWLWSAGVGAVAWKNTGDQLEEMQGPFGKVQSPSPPLWVWCGGVWVWSDGVGTVAWKDTWNQLEEMQGPLEKIPLCRNNFNFFVKM